MLNTASSNTKSKQQSLCEREARGEKTSPDSSETAAGLEKTEEQILKKSQKHLESLGIKNPQQQKALVSQMTCLASALVDAYLTNKNAN